VLFLRNISRFTARWMVFLSILDKETGPPHADFISSLHLDENNFRER